MKKTDRNSLISIVVVVVIGIGVAFAGSQGSQYWLGLPLFAFAAGLAFILQWLAFIPAYLLQTEKFFDLMGSITYLTASIIAFVFNPLKDFRSIMVLVLVSIWAIRLGTFLFVRIIKAGKDARFDEIKPSFFRFLNTWTLQGLWVTLTLSAALVIFTTTTRKPLGIYAIIGLMVWIMGFTFEVIADYQKSRFRQDPQNKGKFIQSGLWACSRHPNYFGEIVLWIGIAIIALPVLKGWQWLSLISPIFVTLLLTKVSGIPILEKRAEEKWGGQEDYEKYKRNTPRLIPKL
jgi:steroid 5-alpha reductase family enzyme